MTKQMACRILAFLRLPRWKRVLECTYTSGKKRSQMGINPIDDMSHVQELRKHVRDGIMTLFHDAGHDILIYMETSRCLCTALASVRERGQL